MVSSFEKKRDSAEHVPRIFAFRVRVNTQEERVKVSGICRESPAGSGASIKTQLTRTNMPWRTFQGGDRSDGRSKNEDDTESEQEKDLTADETTERTTGVVSRTVTLRADG